MSKTRIIWLSIGTTLVVAYLVWALFFVCSQPNTEICTHINVYVKDSLQRTFVSPKDIQQLLVRKAVNPVGKTMDEINISEIEDAIITHNMIKKIECYKTSVNTINVELTQRVPKLRVMTMSDNYYIDTERKKMPVSTQHVAYVPIVSGRIGFIKASSDIFDFITFLEKNSFWNAQIEQIYVREDGKIELVPRVGNHVVLLGTLDGYEQKLAKLQKLYTDGFGKIGWKKYREIDLQYKGQVVCKK